MLQPTNVPERPQRHVGGWWGPAVGVSALGFYAAVTAEGTPGREIGFNADHPWAVYAFMAALVGLMGTASSAMLGCGWWGARRPASFARSRTG